MSNETKQTAVELLWNMIPESTKKYIEHQFNGYRKAKELEQKQSQAFANYIVGSIENGLPPLCFNDWIKITKDID